LYGGTPSRVDRARRRRDRVRRRRRREIVAALGEYAGDLWIADGMFR